MSEYHEPEAEAAITAEITRQILSGHHERPELRVGVEGALANMTLALGRLAEAIAPALWKFEATMTRWGQEMADQVERYANGEGR